MGQHYVLYDLRRGEAGLFDKGRRNELDLTPPPSDEDSAPLDEPLQIGAWLERVVTKLDVAPIAARDLSFSQRIEWTSGQVGLGERACGEQDDLVLGPFPAVRGEVMAPVSRQPDPRADVAGPVLLDDGFGEAEAEVDRGDGMTCLVIGRFDESRTFRHVSRLSHP